MEYSVNQIAEKLSVGTETVRRWIRSGQLHATRLGGRSGYKITQKDFDDFLDKRNMASDMSALDDLDSDNILSLLQNTLGDEDDEDRKANAIRQRYLLNKELLQIDEMILKLQKQRNEIQAKIEILGTYGTEDDYV